MPNSLPVWTIYESPKDFPGKFVVRKHIILPGKTFPTGEYALFDSLEEARDAIPEGCANLGRYAEDEPQIVESWM